MPIDIIVSVKSVITEKTISIDNKTPNGLSLRYFQVVTVLLVYASSESTHVSLEKDNSSQKEVPLFIK